MQALLILATLQLQCSVLPWAAWYNTWLLIKRMPKGVVFSCLLLFSTAPFQLYRTLLLAGIVPYINASIILQLLATSFPSLKKLQREEGPQGRARFQLYQKLAALVFALAQSVGQLTYIRPYVTDFGPEWLLVNSLSLTAGAMVLVHVSASPPGQCGVILGFSLNRRRKAYPFLFFSSLFFSFLSGSPGSL